MLKEKNDSASRRQILNASETFCSCDGLHVAAWQLCLSFSFFFFASSALPRQHVTYMEINDFLNVLDLLSHSKEVVWCSQMPATP